MWAVLEMNILLLNFEFWIVFHSNYDISQDIFESHVIYYNEAGQRFLPMAWRVLEQAFLWFQCDDFLRINVLSLQMNIIRYKFQW